MKEMKEKGENALEDIEKYAAEDVV